jgi:protein SCO1/2
VSRAWFVTILAVLAFAAGLGAAWQMSRMAAPPGAGERPRVRGDFALIDTAGRAVPWSEIGGRRQLVFFGFTNCPEVCPSTLASASLALETLGPAAADMRVLLISVDPVRDTPEVLRDYVGRFGPRVVGYTADAAGLAAAAAAFGVFYEAMPATADGGYMVNHTATLFLLGQGDEILELVPYGASADDIAAAVRRHS